MFAPTHYIIVAGAASLQRFPYFFATVLKK
jgi:hypothetical protein